MVVNAAFIAWTRASSSLFCPWQFFSTSVGIILGVIHLRAPRLTWQNPINIILAGNKFLFWLRISLKERSTNPREQDLSLQRPSTIFEGCSWSRLSHIRTGGGITYTLCRPVFWNFFIQTFSWSSQFTLDSVIFYWLTFTDQCWRALTNRTCLALIKLLLVPNHHYNVHYVVKNLRRKC